MYTLVITSKILHIINALQYLHPSMISVILLNSPPHPSQIHTQYILVLQIQNSSFT